MGNKVNFFEINGVSDIAKAPAKEKMILCDGLSSLEVLQLCSLHSAQHVVQKSNLKTDDEIKFSKSAVVNPQIFFKFPLSVIFGEEHPSDETEKLKTVFVHDISCPTERDFALQNVEASLNQLKVRQSVASDVFLAAGELISNALFNAPYTSENNVNADVERDYAKISVEPTKKPRFFMAIHEDRIVIGCTDYYGRLDVGRLLERIRLCYEKNPADMIKFKTGGAGIGSYLIFETCASYYVAVDPGKSTTVCSTFPLNMTPKQRNQLPKNVHIILT